MKILESIGIFLGARLKQVYDRVVAHVGDFNNPHRVSKTQVGLDRVDNTADADKPVSHPQQAAIGGVAAGLLEHTQAGDIHKTSGEIRAEITEADIPDSIARVADVNTADEKITSLLDAETTRAKEAEQAIADRKVDKETGKGLSSNDYTTAEKNKLGNIGRYLAYTYTEMSEEEGIRQQVLKANQIDPDTGKVTVVDTLLKKADVETNGLLTAGGFMQLEGLKRNGVSLDVSGTPSATWHIGTPSGVITKNSGGVLELRNAADNAYAGLVVDSLTVKGNMVVDGNSFVVNSQTVETADNLILLNRGEVGAGVTKGVAGLEIDRGTADNYKIIFDESDDRFKAGAGADLWPIMLRDREADLADGNVLIWDATTKRAKAAGQTLGNYLPLSGGVMTGSITVGPEMGILSSRGDGHPLVMQNITGTEIIIGSLGNDLITMYTSGNNLIHGVLDGASIISYTIWDEGNDGSGSGLDADLLDGRHGSEYALKTEISSGLALGETASTAYRGDRGKVAYDYSQGTRTIAEINGLQNALNRYLPLSGGTMKSSYASPLTLDTTSTTNYLTFRKNGVDKGYVGLGSSANEDMTVSAHNGHVNLLTSSGKKAFYNYNEIATIDQIPTKLPADGGNANTIGGISNRDLFVINRDDISIDNINTFINRESGTYKVTYTRGSYQLTVFKCVGSSTALELYNDYGLSFIDVRTNIDGNRYSSWKGLAFKTDIPTSLPADGGNADTIGGTGVSGLLKQKLARALNLDATGNAGIYNILSDTQNNIGITYGCFAALDGNDAQMYFATQHTQNSMPRLKFRNGYDGHRFSHWAAIANLSDIPTSLPASDVYAWAKASTKPSYSVGEISNAAAKSDLPNVFVQATAPTSGMKKGDIWVKP